VLATVATDPVHAYLQAAYEARIDEAIACLPRLGRLPIALEVRLTDLERIERYKVERLREASSVLTHEHDDAIGAFASRRHEPDDLLDQARRLPDDARVRPLEAVLDGSPDLASLQGVLDALETLPPKLAAPLLERTLGAIGTPKPIAKGADPDAERQKLQLLGQALALMARVDPKRASAFASELATKLDGDLRSLDAVLLRAARPLRGSPLLRTLLFSANPQPHDGKAPTAGIAMAVVAIGADAKGLIAELHAAVEIASTQTVRLDAIRSLAEVYAIAPADVALPGLARLRVYFADTTDSFGTNSHFNLSTVRLVSSIAMGIAGG
jgi:cellulose synthase operon protein C